MSGARKLTWALFLLVILGPTAHYVLVDRPRAQAQEESIQLAETLRVERAKERKLLEEYEKAQATYNATLAEAYEVYKEHAAVQRELQRLMEEQGSEYRHKSEQD